jgi:hypothetical protein
MSEISNGKPRWPKDYLKHLRTVHFALITVSTILIVLSSSPSKTNVEVAREQNGQIRELMHKLEVSWLGDYSSDAVAKYQRNARSGDGEPPSFPAVMIHPGDVDTVEYAFEAPYEGHQNVVLPIRIEKRNWALVSNELIRQRSQRDKQWASDWPDDFRIPGQLNRKPTTLQDFRIYWDNLGTSDLYLEIPHGLASAAYVEFNGLLMVPTTNIKFSKTGEHAYCELVLKKLDEAHREILTHQLGFNGTSDYYYSVGRPAHPGRIEADFDASDRSPIETLIVPADNFTQKVEFDGQGALIAHTPQEWHWKHGKFAQVFESLADITKTYETLPPDVIDDVLASEEARYGESFQALGIKFPAENTTLWGILIIFVIQIYLLVQSREFDLKHHRAAAEAEVAWVALYPSAFARLLTFISICVLPAAAVVFMAVRTRRFVGLSYFYDVLLAFACFSVIGLGIAFWMRLPTSGPKPAPAAKKGPVEARGPSIDGK